MTIESSLERIASALERMEGTASSAAVYRTATLLAAEKKAEATGTVQTVTLEPKRRGRPPKNLAAAAVAPVPVAGDADADYTLDDAPEVTAEVTAEVAPDETPEEEPEELTVEQVRSALIAYQKKHSPEQARKLLREVGGVAALQQLPKSKFADVFEAAKQ